MPWVLMMLIMSSTGSIHQETMPGFLSKEECVTAGTLWLANTEQLNEKAKNLSEKIHVEYAISSYTCIKH